MTVSLERIDASLGRITLSNPPANSLDRPDFMDLSELTNFLAQADLKGVILRGNGRHFCAGADLQALQAQQVDPASFMESLTRGKQLLETINRATVPIVAIIKGSCLGAGLEIALSCHFRFCTPHALLGFPESQHGFMPGMGGTVFTPNILSLGHAIDLIVSGRCILGEEALQRGLVDQIYAPADLEDAAVKYLKSLTERHHPHLIRNALASIHDGRFLPRHEALEHESRRFFELIQEAHLGE